MFLFASLKAVGAKESNPTQRNKLRGGLEEELRHRQQQERQLDADTYIFETVADGAAQGQGDKVGTSCSTDGRWMSFVDDAVDYMDIATTKWHSPGYRMDCKDKGSHTNWQCWATCSPFPNPNFLDWTYLTMEVKLVNAANLATGCGPNIKITKRWPSYSSNVLSLSGDYVDGGALADSEFRRVVIPMGTYKFLYSVSISLGFSNNSADCSPLLPQRTLPLRNGRI